KLEKLKAIAADEGDGAVRVGIPLCLNMYELLPFWHTLLRELGFKVVVSPVSDNALFRKGQNSIPSDTVCFPAKMAHGHIQALLEAGVDAIFYPCMSYNLDEGLSDRHYNCPVVAYYPELLADNIKGLRETDFFYEYVDLSRRRDFTAIFPRLLLKHFPSLRKKDIVQAISRAYDALEEYREDVRRQAADIMCKARKEGKHIIVLAGRPYHVDPEINHGIDRLMSRCNAAVVSEDSICHLGGRAETGVLNQWTYHARLYAAARYCAAHEDCDLIQLVSFGCGLDAITADETKEILHNSGKLYTQLKIDEITNLSAVNIRIRSLFAALKARKEKR
ncbi:MAG: 2-hydroxyacyl-CoA dehydratase, partial [Solobacterium sp.]|nr:2-hydroxyacyl-CoA dehydratase [Solobacterium sp.]